jgi:hypothetical protein
VLALAKEPSFDVSAVVSHLLDRIAHCLFVHRDEVCVFLLLVLVQFDEVLLFGEFELEFADLGFCSAAQSVGCA